MEKEFLVLVVIGLATFAAVLVVILNTITFEEVTADEMELYWQGCDNGDVKGFEYQADCELRQALVDANLMDGVNSGG